MTENGSIAYMRGYRACMRGDTRRTNPYEGLDPLTQQERMRWDKGYDDRMEYENDDLDEHQREDQEG